MNASPQKRLGELTAEGERLLGVDYFVALGVARTASVEEIKNAFIEAAKKWHPDRVPDGAEALRPLFMKVFGRLDMARATLSDHTRRARYVEELSKPQVAATTGDVAAAEAALEFKKAEVLFKRNENAAAEIHLRRAAQLAPSNVDYQAILIAMKATPAMSADGLRAILMDLDRLIARDDKCERAFVERAQIRKRLGLLREANADFVRAADLNPRNVDALREIRLYNFRQEKKATQEGAPKSQKPDVIGFFRRLLKR